MPERQLSGIWRLFVLVTQATYVGDMYSSVTSCTLVGVEPLPVRIEASVSHAKKDTFTIVGLPDTAVRTALAAIR